MNNLLGIIAHVKELLSDTEEVIAVSKKNGDDLAVLCLAKGREYVIPDFQRQIRWTEDDVAVLIEDIRKGSKFLGNIILTKHSEQRYSIIDGQQRITILTMILSCIRQLHENKIETICPCKLMVQSFSEFSELITNGFDEKSITEKTYQADKLNQLQDYTDLWNYIRNTEEVKNKRIAKDFMRNLRDCTFNIIINESSDVSDGIRYFIDVNLKGKQLDTEDIFKSYLFKNDTSEEIRTRWYTLKKTAARIEQSKMEYPFLKMLEHYFRCDVYQGNAYKGMEFGEDFLLKKQYKEEGEVYRKGTHLIELISNNEYMIESLEKLNQIVTIMLNIVSSDSTTEEMKKIFLGENGETKIDTVELKVIHNIIGKILKDKDAVPKALVMKYISILLDVEQSKRKEHIRTIYGVYLFYVLFLIFTENKDKEILINIIRGDDKVWYGTLISQIDSFLADDHITDTRLVASYRLGRNMDEEDQQFKSKSLATVYNYFVRQNGKVVVRKGAMNDLYQFITNSEIYSTEHFIISESKKKQILVNEEIYEIEPTVYNRYKNNFFNFIFIDRMNNSQLGNNWLPKKLELLEGKEIKCEYSAMVIENAKALGEEFKKRDGKRYKSNLDYFFYKKYKEEYIRYARSVLTQVILKISGKNVDADNEDVSE